MLPVITEERDGILMTLGAQIRPPDPREDKYRLTRTMPPRAIDLNQPHVIDILHRSAIKDQGGLGACAGFSTAAGAEAAARISGRVEVPDLHAGWLYREARLIRGWGNLDSGSYVADNCDVAMMGAPRQGLHDYVQDATFAYPTWLTDDRFGQDYVLSHRPFYPTEGNIIENLALALDAGMPVVLSSYWPNEWFSPNEIGAMPGGLRPGPNMGAHAYLAWGCIPGYAAIDNSWTPGWNPAIGVWNGQFGLRPGSALIPWEYFLPENGMVYELRALSFEPVKSEPEPNPEPVERTYWQGYGDAKTHAVEQVTHVRDAYQTRYQTATSDYFRSRHKYALNAVQTALNGVESIAPEAGQ